MRFLVPVAALATTALLLALGSEEIPFRKHVLDPGRNESCAVADLNRDGRLDIISGENWFEGPSWTRHKFRSLPFWSNYLDNFSDHALDVNGDGYPDVVSVAWNARRIAWWENPGPPDLTQPGEWKMHLIDSGYPVEFSFLVDLDNDGRALELLPQFGDPKAPLAWYEVSWGQWIKHQVSDHSYGHGIGAGDVNGDGRTDIITPKGWFEAPSDPRRGAWTFHEEFDLGATGFIYVVDVNGDKLPDLVYGMAHDYGLFWMEQVPGSPRKWVKHMIDDAWSQAHAVTLVDLNGDGRPELVTGKRLYAHNGHDPGERESLGVYWYEYVQNGDHWDWIRHIIDYGGSTGGGMQIPVVDIDGDGDLDIVVAGKSGLYLFENLIPPKHR
ncbi:MAG: VCBS repeat-containing protein [Acidobacteria bacterium]|nr:VCBS repeat-containing protein [Acidobacteriota bacterium]